MGTNTSTLVVVLLGPTVVVGGAEVVDPADVVDAIDVVGDMVDVDPGVTDEVVTDEVFSGAVVVATDELVLDEGTDELVVERGVGSELPQPIAVNVPIRKTANASARGNAIRCRTHSRPLARISLRTLGLSRSLTPSLELRA